MMSQPTVAKSQPPSAFISHEQKYAALNRDSLELALGKGEVWREEGLVVEGVDFDDGGQAELVRHIGQPIGDPSM